MRSKVAERVREEQDREMLSLTAVERIDLAFAIGEEDLLRYAQTSGLTRDEALSRMSGKAIPFLLADLQSKDTPLRGALVAFVKAHPSLPITLTSAGDRHRRAIRALRILSVHSKEAILLLTRRSCIHRLVRTAIKNQCSTVSRELLIPTRKLIEEEFAQR